MNKFVFLHGLGQSAAAWNDVLVQLDNIDKCLAPELSHMCGDPANYNTLYQKFSEYCSNSGDDPLNLAGLSLGGMLALNYAAEHPEKVRSLVLIGTQYRSPKALLKLQNIIFKLMPKSSFKDTGFGKKDFISLCNSMAELDLGSSLKNIHCPALILIGEDDKPNRKAAEEMSKLIDNAKFAEIGSSGHEANIDAPKRLSESIKQFYETENIL